MLMRDEEVRSEQPIDEGPEVQEALLAEAQPEDALVTEPRGPTNPAPPITSRFLFVNVAGQRAKQLRRGAIVRLEPDTERLSSSKAERVAMEEVRRRLVYWEMPEWHPVTAVEVEPPPKRRRTRKQREEDAA